MGKMADGFTGTSGFIFKHLYKAVAWAGSFLITALPVLLYLGVVYGVLVAISPALAAAVTIDAVLTTLLASVGLPTLIAIPIVGVIVKTLIDDIITPWKEWYVKLINGAEFKKDRPWWSLELENDGTKIEKGQEYDKIGKKGYDFGVWLADSIMAIPSNFVAFVTNLVSSSPKVEPEKENHEEDKSSVVVESQEVNLETETPAATKENTSNSPVLVTKFNNEKEAVQLSPANPLVAEKEYQMQQLGYDAPKSITTQGSPKHTMS